MSGAMVARGDGALDEREVGDKLARQRKMASRGLRVPPFFCLTVHFYERVFEQIRPRVNAALAAIAFSDAASIRRASAAIATAFVEAPLQPSEETRILAAFDAMFAPTELVAVRASTVGRRLEESEDSASNPFAGMSETSLFVPRRALVTEVRRVWASGFSEQSLVYRHAQGFDLAGFGVAIGVQKMIAAERSFLLFTSNPKTATRETVIVAGFGAGEGVVQERVGVDHYFVPSRGREVRRELGEKTERLVFDAARGVGLRSEPVAPDRHAPPCLEPDEISALVELGARIERSFGAPQDIEGVIDAAGAVHVVQARPIAFDYAAMRVWTNANVTESFPGATTALTYGFARFFYRVIFWDCYRRLGIPLRALHENFDPLDRMIGFLGGRVYYNLSAFYRLHSQSPLFPLFRASWEAMMGFRSSYQAHAPSVLARVLDRIALGWRLVRASAVVSIAFFNHDRAMARFSAWWESLIAPLRGADLGARSPLALVAEYRRVWLEVGREWGVTLLNDTYLPMLHGATQSLFSRWGLSADPSLASDLLCGDEAILSVEIVYSAVRLAERVQALPPLREAFERETPDALWRALDGGELDEGFTAAVREHLDRYGDRGLEELKMEQPNLRDQPAALLRTIAGYVRAGVSEAAMRSAERDVRAQADVRLRERLSGEPLKELVLSWLLGRARSLIRHRESSRYRRSELFGFSKNVFHALGDHLVARGALRSRDDVVHLTPDEIFGWFDGTGVTEDLQAIADLRRRELAANAALETPMEITTLGAVRDHAIATPASADAGRAGASAGAHESSGPLLSGLGSSAGRVRGRARVVLDPHRVEGLGPDAILIAKETDPGWLFLMLAAKGIVVERGSMLSHTAITGRKFGIPTVVAVPGATRRIADGAWIEIDGARGTVRLLEDPERAGGVSTGEAAVGASPAASEARR
jgi:pyruvate,water dikinase